MFFSARINIQDVNISINHPNKCLKKISSTFAGFSQLLHLLQVKTAGCEQLFSLQLERQHSTNSCRCLRWEWRGCKRANSIWKTNHTFDSSRVECSCDTAAGWKILIHTAISDVQIEFRELDLPMRSVEIFTVCRLRCSDLADAKGVERISCFHEMTVLCRSCINVLNGNVQCCMNWVFQVFDFRLIQKNKWMQLPENGNSSFYHENFTWMMFSKKCAFSFCYSNTSMQFFNILFLCC